MKCGDPNNPLGPQLTLTGQPCGNQCIPPTNRCYQHGGASPGSLIKAKVALAALRLPAIEVAFNAMMALHILIEQWQSSTCSACGLPMGTLEEKEQLIKAAVGAAKTCMAILDRTELGPKATLEVKQSDGDLNLEQFTLDEQAELHALMAQFTDLKERVRRRIMGVVIDIDAVPRIEP